MLYSETKERKNRFITSLKIGFPFFIMTVMGIYLFSISNNNLVNFVLLVLLIPIYIYYILYMIYVGFEHTLIDHITKAFTRFQILQYLKKFKKKNKISSVCMIKLGNIIDINDRYGLENTDMIMESFTHRLDTFLRSYNLKDIPIGRYGGAHFLLIAPTGSKELQHLLGIFEKELKNRGINDIELKLQIAVLPADYDDNCDNTVKKLLSMFDEASQGEDLIPNIKPSDFESLIVEAIKNESFIFKYQPARDENTQNCNIIDVLPKIYTKKEGMLSRTQIERIVNHLGLENTFDKKIFSSLLKELESYEIPKNLRFNLRLSAVTLRNTEFRQYITELFFHSKLQPEQFILEFSEKTAYDEMHRFYEILIQYKKQGFGIALDNFGGKNDSMEYVKNLPIDMVKFDLEFTKKLDDTKYHIILASYIQMLKNLNIKVMVKFVDKNTNYDLLRNLHVEFIQGFIVSKPKNINQILKENNEIR